jgi:hypothetical protein
VQNPDKASTFLDFLGTLGVRGKLCNVGGLKCFAQLSRAVCVDYKLAPLIVQNPGKASTFLDFLGTLGVRGKLCNVGGLKCFAQLSRAVCKGSINGACLSQAMPRENSLLESWSVTLDFMQRRSGNRDSTNFEFRCRNKPIYALKTVC